MPAAFYRPLIFVRWCSKSPRVVAGSATQSTNASSYVKRFGTREVTVSQPGGVKLEFRGANGDTSRAIPGGDTSLSFLVSDFIGTREGAIDLTLTGLAPGNYVFRSYHLDPFTGSGLGFAQGSTATTPNTIEARVDGESTAELWKALAGDGSGA